MPAKRNCRTYRNAAPAQEVPVLRVKLPAEEPIRRYPHPIPQSVSPSAAETVPILTGDTSAAMTQILEQLNLQSQLLVDLLSAINALTTATLAQANKV